MVNKLIIGSLLKSKTGLGVFSFDFVEKKETTCAYMCNQNDIFMFLEKNPVITKYGYYSYIMFDVEKQHKIIFNFSDDYEFKSYFKNV